MVDPAARRRAKMLPLPEQVALVLQGGGALGSYQAGVIDGLEATGIELDWVAGISIGAVNAAIVAGNPPERRVRTADGILGQGDERVAQLPDLSRRHGA